MLGVIAAALIAFVVLLVVNLDRVRRDVHHLPLLRQGAQHLLGRLEAERRGRGQQQGVAQRGRPGRVGGEVTGKAGCVDLDQLRIGHHTHAFCFNKNRIYVL